MPSGGTPEAPGSGSGDTSTLSGASGSSASTNIVFLSPDISPGDGCRDTIPTPTYDTPDRTAGGGSVSREDQSTEIPNGGTALYDIVRVPYGTQRVPGTVLAWKKTSAGQQQLRVLWLLGFGEIDSFVSGGITLNDEVITSVPGYVVSSLSTRRGEVNQTITYTIGTLLSGVETYPGMILVEAGFMASAFVAAGGSLNLKADMLGRKCYEFRSAKPGYGTRIFTNNPVLVVYDILTSKWPWTGEIDSADIDIASWTECANRCATKVGSPLANRFTYRGLLENRNTWDAANEVMSYFHGHVSVVGDKWYMWMEDDETTIPKSTLAISDYISTPVITELEPGLRTTEASIEYISEEGYEPRSVICNDSAYPEKYVREEIVKNGFKTGSECYRWGNQHIRLRREVKLFNCTTGPEAANVLPGQVIWMYFPNGFGWQECRIMSMPIEVQSGKFSLTGRIIAGTVRVDGGIGSEVASGYSPEVGTGTPDTPAAPSGDVATASLRYTARGVRTSFVTVEWLPPEDGARVHHYNVYQGSVLLASTTSLSWTGEVLALGLTETFSVCAVGYDGTESSPLDSDDTNVQGGEVNRLRNIELETQLDTDGGLYVLDKSRGVIAEGVLNTCAQYWTGVTCTSTSTSIALSSSNPNPIDGTVLAVVGGITAGSVELFDMSISGTNLVINKASSSSTTFDVVFITSGRGINAFDITGSTRDPDDYDS